MYTQLGKDLVRLEKVPIGAEGKVLSIENQRRSYNKFIETGLEKAVQKAFDYIRERTSQDFEVIVEIGKLEQWPREVDKMIPVSKGYPVTIQLVIGGVTTPAKFPLLTIPYMDGFGVLNISGERKVLLGEISSLETVSIDTKEVAHKKETFLVVTMENNPVTLKVSDKSIDFKISKGFKNAATTVEALYYLYRDIMDKEYTVDEIFESSIVKLTQKIPELTESENSYLEMSRYNIDLWGSKEVSPSLRKNLNKMLGFETAINKIVADDIVVKGHVTVPKGTRLTRTHADYLSVNNIFKIAVKAIPNISGNYLAEEVTITHIPKDVPISEFMRIILPEDKLGKGRQTSQDITDINIPLTKDTQLSKDLVELLYYCGVEELMIKTSKSAKAPRRITFKQEILSNVPNMSLKFKERLGKDILNPYDISALMSYAIRAHQGDIKDTFNRDKDFIKKVSLHNEIFSESIYSAMVSVYKKYKTNLDKFIQGAALHAESNDKAFSGFHKEWLDQMSLVKPLLRTEDDTNPLATLSQVNQTIYHTMNSKSVPGILRTLALPFFGRLCPYETPQSKKIGLVNTLTIGCDVIDGIPKTQYYKLQKTPQGLKVTGEVEWLSSEEEQDINRACRIGDLISLEIDEEGYIKEGLTLARIPSNPESDERMSIAEVYSSTLTHINVLPEQHISPTAMMIPFAASNDGARITFGMSLMKQALHLAAGDKPLVTTSMYRDIYNHSGYYVLRAEKSGYVVSIEPNRITVRYDGESSDRIIDVIETRVTSLSVTIMNFKVQPGAEFKANDILADSPVAKDGFFSPGINCLVAYVCDGGWNYEDAIVPSDHVSHRMTSVSIDTQKAVIRSKENSSTKKTPNMANMHTYVDTETNLIEVHSKVRFDLDDKGRVEPIKSNYNGVMYPLHPKHNKIRVGSSSNGERADEWEYRFRIMDLKPLRTGDKMAGRHGNKGVASVIRKVSEMPVFNNGVTVDIMLNPSGVVSRMNIGQILEAHAGFCAYLLGIVIETDPFNGAHTREVKELMHYLHDVANCGGNISTTNSKWSNKIPQFIMDRATERLDFIMEWENCFTSDGKARLYNPVTGTYFENLVTFGYSYMVKTVQEADDKIHARSGPLCKEPYTQIDKQPPKGSSRGGGQRIGEMEAAAIAAHGATAVYEEMFQVKSDNTPMQVNLSVDMLGSEDKVYTEDQLIPRSIDLLRYQLEPMGIAMHIGEHIYPPVDHDSILERNAYSIQDLAKSITNKDREKHQEYKKESDSQFDAVSQYEYE